MGLRFLVSSTVLGASLLTVFSSTLRSLKFQTSGWVLGKKSGMIPRFYMFLSFLNGIYDAFSAEVGSKYDGFHKFTSSCLYTAYCISHNARTTGYSMRATWYNNVQHMLAKQHLCLTLLPVVRAFIPMACNYLTNALS